jgi:chromosome segregation ATPase
MTDFRIIQGQMKDLSEALYKVKSTVDRLEANWDKDRKDFAEFEARLGHTEVELRSLKEYVQRLPQRISDKIEEVTDPIIQEMSDFQDVMQEKKVVAIDKHEAKKQTKAFWKKILRRKQ